MTLRNQNYLAAFQALQTFGCDKTQMNIVKTLTQEGWYGTHLLSVSQGSVDMVHSHTDIPRLANTTADTESQTFSDWKLNPEIFPEVWPTSDGRPLCIPNHDTITSASPFSRCGRG